MAQGPSGPRLYAGRQTEQLVEHMLGLDTAPEEWRVRFVAYYDDRLMVLLGPKGSPRIVLIIRKSDPKEPAWVQLDHLSITYQGTTQVPEIVDTLVRRFAPQRLSQKTIDDLLKMVEADPEAKPLPDITKEGHEVTNLLTSWAGPDAYAEFFAVGEIARSQLDSIDLSGAFRFVQHCETECLMQAPHAVAPLVSLVDFPWDNRIRALDWHQPLPRLDPNVDGMVTTEMTDKDVIFGNPKRLREVLDYVVSAPNPEGKIIFFSNTCVPMVIGEDVESVVRQYARKSRVPLVYLTVTPKSMYNVFRDLLYRRRMELEETSGPPDPLAVNLIGFQEGPASAGVVELLEAVGLRVNTYLIPDFSVKRIEALPKAALSVFYPNRVWSNHYAHLTEGTRIKTLMPDAPYGFEGSRAWLMEVAKALGKGQEATRGFEALAERYQAAFDRMRKEASGLTLGFVVRAEEVFHLTDPSTTWGVPLIKFLEEAGFHIEVLLKASQKQQAREALEAIKGVFRNPKEHLTLRAFNSFERLRKLLRESQAQAFLSYHFFDFRLSEAGKARFSLQVFEMGLPGAVRTIRRLVQICRTPFYRTYSRFLARRIDGMPLAKGGHDGTV